MLPTHYLYRAVTRNRVQPGPEVCCLCGAAHGSTTHVSEVLQDTFTNHGMCRAPHSSSVCEACAHYFTHRWDKGQTYPAEYRKHSFTVTRQGWREWPRARMRGDLERWLHRGCPEGVFVVGLSKKKHCLPLAMVNAPGRAFTVQVEEDRVQLGDHYWPLMSAFACLMGLGAKKGEILSGEYHHATLRRLPSADDARGKPVDLSVILDMDRTIAAYRPSPLLSLVSYLYLDTEEE